MKKWLLIFVGGVLLCTVVFAGQPGPVFTPTDTPVNLPVPLLGGPSGELDEVFTDSLYYFTYVDQPLHFSQLTGYYAGQRFLIPVDFDLQGVRFYALDDEVPYASCWVYANDPDTNTPSTLIAQIWDAEEPTDNDDGWVELSLDEEDFISLEQSDEVWIVVGPVPGEDGAGGWSIWLDNDGPVPGARSKTATSDMAPDNMSYTVPYDWMMVACGEFTGDYFDFRALSLYNDIQKFHILEGDTVELTGKFFNRGTIESPDPTVLFTITDIDDDTVFSCDMDIDPIEEGSADTVTVTCSDLWICNETGKYIATARIFSDEDEILADDNDTKLLQCVVTISDTMSYYDDELEVSIGSSAGTGWGVPFYPVRYPALVENVAWYDDADSDSSILRIWIMDEEGNYEEAWSTNEGLLAGWNEFDLSSEEMPDGLVLEEGEFVIAGFGITAEGLTWHLDSSPPVSAANADMPVGCYRFIGDSLAVATFGNFPVRASFGNVPPAPFELIYPGNNETVTTESFEFAWHSTYDPEGQDVFYDIYVGWNPNNLGDPYAAGLTDTTIIYNGADGQNLYWKVHAYEGDTDGTFTEMWAFTINVNHPPEAFQLLQPDNNTFFPYENVHDVLLDWEDSEDPDPEHDVLYLASLVVNCTAKDTSVQVDSVQLSRLTVDIPELAGINMAPPWNDSVYVEWRIAAIAGGDTVYSDETWNFVLEPELAVPEQSFSGIPEEFGLAALYPNPFNPSTTVVIALAETAELEVTVFNVMGQKVATLANDRYQAGYQSLTFDGSTLASGVYFMRVNVPGKLNELRKVMLLK